MKKKIMIDLLVAVLMVSIVGCGKGNAELQQEVVQETFPTETVTEESESVSVSEEISVEMGNADEGEEVTLSEKEQEDLQALVSGLTLNSYHRSENMYGNHYPVSDLAVDMITIDILGTQDEIYTKYLPPTETEGYIRYCKPDEVKDYLKNVFGIENADLSAYCEGDRVVFDMMGDYLLTEVSIDNASVTADGTYKIEGKFFLWEATDMLEAVYPYELTVIKNDESPFGFQLVSMEYREEVTADYEPAEQSIAEGGSLGDILLNPKENSAYYPREVEYQQILFALLDIDKDGEDEILLGSASDVSPYWGASWVTIFNILKYDRTTGEVSDFDGDRVYMPLDANSWHYYDTGILMTMAEAGQGHTNFWNLRTGEFVDAALQVSEDSDSPDSTGHSKIYNVDGRDITGTEADQYYQSLKSGKEIRIIWCEVNQGNVEALMTNGNITTVYIPMPRGTYTGTRGASLEFYNDNTVLVSEGNSHTRCSFTIDGMGNLVIDPDGEALEGVYDALANEIKIGAMRFSK